MTYAKISVTQELRRMARGQKTQMHPAIIASLVLGGVPLPCTTRREGDEVQFLERLFRLQDPR
jgi:hypothetical protein